MGSNSFDHPLSSRFDDQDAYTIFDDVEVPYERVFINGDIDVYNSVMGPTAWWANIMQQTTIRALTKLEFAYGLALRMAEAVNDNSPTTTEMLGELSTYVEVTRSPRSCCRKNTPTTGATVSSSPMAARCTRSAPCWRCGTPGYARS